MSTNIRINDEDLISELKRMSEELKRSPKKEEFSKYCKYSVNAYVRRFGSLNGALVAANLKLNQKKNQTKEDVITEIQKLYIELNRIPSTEEFSQLSIMTYNTLRNVTNGQSWHSLLKEAGISDSEIAALQKKNITDEELKEEVLRLKEKFGRYANSYEIQKESKFSISTYEQRFGSFVKTMHGLGFSDYIPQNVYYNQTYTTGLDGKLYRSAFEAYIANILIKFKEFGIIKDFQYEKKICEDRTWTCDFYIIRKDNLEVWLESDGMLDKRKDPYDGLNEKITFYKQNNMNLHIVKYMEDGVEDILSKIVQDTPSESVKRIVDSINLNEVKPLKKIDEQTKNDIVDKYISGDSSEKIAKDVDIHSTTVLKLLKRSNVQIRPACENKTIYDKDNHWIDTIDNQNKAYFLGLMIAGGSVSSARDSCTLTIMESDKDILEKISYIVYGTNLVKIYDTDRKSRSAHLDFYGEDFKRALIRHKCVPNKTFITRYPGTVPNDLDNHFIRGLFDGTGGIYIIKPNRVVVEMSGTKELLDVVKEKIINSIGEIDFPVTKNEKQGGSIESFRLGKKISIIKFLDYLYKDADIFLQRKYDKYQEIMQIFSNKD